ncbi:DUF2306 domain-containing protein [Kordia sp. YSTF-M3]|uniref:DUF2306 domain-containing protein n=1 Tax=Kordia aestuariivivens TaxID=2759037 RepID=A0ABR7Q926_9FLAO|nr:DUF2306 domain-containing protein [Kordia aestuariivivens]MBC8755069.1 DUF2306 domain-containing protein [Kordia aestuariivivens]
MKKLAWLIFVGSCLLFSFQPVKYFLADGPIGLLNSKPLDSNMYKISFFIHIAFGGIALLIGWIQFSKKFRNKYLKIHRTIGKIYVTSVLISGPFAFYIGFFVYGGIPTQIGFTLGALFWIIATYMGYHAIRNGNVAKHKEYMMYSYAGTFAAVTLRLWLPMLMAFTSFKVAYGISVWLSWLPNVFVAYLIIHKKDALIAIYKKYRIKRVVIAMLILIATAFISSYMSPQTWLYKSATYEGTAFEKAITIANSSFTKEKLNEIDTYLKEEVNTTSMVVLEHGKIVYEYGDISEISYNASVRKSILSMLYGKYVTNGTIDLNQTIGDMGIDEDDGLLPIEKQATIDHIITARSGVFHLPANGGYDTDNVKERGSVAPGSYFLYNNWDYNVAGFILEEKTGNTVYEELGQQLAIPLGFQDWNIENQYRSTNEDNSRYSAYHMHLSTRDMAKIGQLMLQEGTWNGKQLIDKDWIKKTITTVTPTDTISKRYYRDASSPVQSSYGYMWWLHERFYDNPDFEGAYSARGAFGQYITVIPKRDVVIVHKTTVDLLTLLSFSDRSSTPYWRYLWILRTLMLDGKSIEQLATEKSTDEIIEFIKTEYNKDSEYAVSERLINEYGQLLAANEKHEEAIQFYKLNLERYPSGYYTHRTYEYYGHSLVKLGRSDEALTMFEKSLEFHPDNQVAKKEISKLKNN